MDSLLDTLSKDHPLYALNIGQFETLMQEIMNKNMPAPVAQIEARNQSDELSITECIDYLKISETTLHRYKNNGVIPFYKAGRTIYFKRSEIDAALSSAPVKKKGNKI
ncbi:helix-turn-helix domain-containing protein [Pedobacter zeae]|uniref:Excisionase family DNA binding protein n=1 Tax=Pedobacter zeae TaxID=1737356 RepID=A0A7W6P6V8_9SPHI|nr:helix-turn-helix domain-containing protein [Pedobacter zeae]MBB4108351.1 excisionase family DNA binding protein [Pedobacter zeae]GGG93368.1 hypothetical protein GCM10007422_03220 [Pedobacter zeae]